MEMTKKQRLKGKKIPYSHKRFMKWFKRLSNSSATFLASVIWLSREEFRRKMKIASIKRENKNQKMLLGKKLNYEEVMEKARKPTVKFN